VAEGRGLDPGPWRALRGQIYLGTEAFVHDARARAAQRTRAPEIPQTQRQSQPLGVEHLLPVVLDTLGTTGPELACHPRKRARERAIVAYSLRRFAGATGAVPPACWGSAPGTRPRWLAPGKRTGTATLG
jgi:hypothetical protein